MAELASLLCCARSTSWTHGALEAQAYQPRHLCIGLALHEGKICPGRLHSYEGSCLNTHCLERVWVFNFRIGPSLNPCMQTT